MQGELIEVWPHTWKEIWLKLHRTPDAPHDLFAEMIRQIIPPPIAPVVPPIPPADAYDAAGELLDIEAISVRDAFLAERVKYDQLRGARESAISGENTRTYFKEMVLNVKVEAEAIKFLERGYQALSLFDEEVFCKHIADVDIIHSLRSEWSGFRYIVFELMIRADEPCDFSCPTSPSSRLNFTKSMIPRSGRRRWPRAIRAQLLFTRGARSSLLCNGPTRTIRH